MVIFCSQENSCLEEVCTSHLDGDEKVIDLTGDAGNDEKKSSRPNMSIVKALPDNTAGSKFHSSLVSEAASGTRPKCRRAGS